MKHCWSCYKSNECPRFSPKKKACKEHKFSIGIRSETLREEQIREASIEYQLSIAPRAIGGGAFADTAREMNVNPHFIEGAKQSMKR